VSCVTSEWIIGNYHHIHQFISYFVTNRVIGEGWAKTDIMT